ncbi:hypothetical protein GSbR_09900 [Geobacter sp. SVR]|nr:hypothetical protein GSVR_13130 [Geobacter sp. SVR]GCF84390.1 hypothetical protein GSbR_09900 [Geobacter sp. SVR]
MLAAKFYQLIRLNKAGAAAEKGRQVNRREERDEGNVEGAAAG